MVTSQLSGFYQKSVAERLSIVREFASLSPAEVTLLQSSGALSLDTANGMIENVIGTYALPFGIATNFKINGKERLIPMVLEEPSVVAAASFAAKLALPGGFTASADRSVMKSMVQLVGVKDIKKASAAIQKEKVSLISRCRDPTSSLVKMGGGVFDIVPRSLKTSRGEMLIVDILCDCKDSMGANTVNTAAELLTPILESLTGGTRRLMIISNLADQRLARAEAIWKKDVIGEDVIEGILDAQAFADADPYRGATHNKGIMNGIDAVILATGNDFRAIEAGAHAFATRSGTYRTLTAYEKTTTGDLRGRLELPAAVGIVGGATKTHPLAQIALKILGVTTAQDFASLLAAVGLAQNFASLRAQIAEGIQKGHMSLHATNLARMAGARGKEVEELVKRLSQSGKVTASHAQTLLAELRKTHK